MVENGSEGASDATRSGTETELSLQKLGGAVGSGQAEPAGTVVGCHGQLEMESGTALVLELDQGGEVGQDTVFHVESQAVAVGEGFLFPAPLAEEASHLVSPPA